MLHFRTSIICCFLLCAWIGELKADHPLLEQDWISRDGHYFLAFRPKNRVATGKVVLFHYDMDSKKIAAEAFQGQYTFLKPNVVRLALTFQWTVGVDEDKNFHWRCDDAYGAYQPSYSVDLELELDDPDRIVATAISVDWISRFGDVVRSRDNLDYAKDHLTKGQIFVLEPRSEKLFAKPDPFPALVYRSDWKRNVKDDEHKQSVFATKNLISRLSGWKLYRGAEAHSISGPDDYLLFQFTSSGEWDHGTAWLLTMSQREDGSVVCTAAKGTYSVLDYDLADQDLLAVRLNATRYYTASQGDGRLEWRLTDERARLQFVVPLADSTVPESPTMFLESIDAIDKEGNLTTEYSNSGFLGLPRKVDKFRLGTGHSEGVTYHFRSGDRYGGSTRLQQLEEKYLQLLEQSPPPAFRMEPTAKRHETAKPVTSPNDTSNRPRYYSLFQKGAEADKSNNYSEAKRCYLLSLKENPDYEYTLNALAWLFATCPDEKYRDGNEAVRLAKLACEKTQYKQGWIIDTLAAAYAETGDFQNAIKWQKKAIANTADDKKASLLEHLVLFYERKPVREN